MDLRICDLGLFEDKLERAVREGHSKYLLQDCRSRRVILILPSVLPHLILSSILSVFFNYFQNPSISLFPSAALSTVAAGCRSALVIDIGWRETIMTAIDDYKEMMHKRSERAMRRLTLETSRVLKKKAREDSSESSKGKDGGDLGDADIEMCEEIAGRLSICNSKYDGKATSGTTAVAKPVEDDKILQESKDSTFSVPSPVPPHHMLKVPLSTFTELTETTFFAASRDLHDVDDDEQPLHHLLFQTLLSLPPDIRGACMSRIIITGGGSNIPGLKTRLLQELSSILVNRGWDPVSGKAHEEHRRKRRLREVNGNWQNRPPQTVLLDEKVAAEMAIKPVLPSLPPTKGNNNDNIIISAASQEPQVQDEITEKLLRDKTKVTKSSSISGQVRCVETLGAWAGASLLSSLKVKGVVEIERDVFLQHGMAGAARGDVDATTGGGGGGGDGNKAKRQSMGPAAAAAARAGAGDRKSWTLGIWA